MTKIQISRRALLFAAAAASGCGRRKAPRMSGFCFVANQGSRTIAVVNLETFRVVKQISLEGAPEQVIAHPAAPKIFALAPANGTLYEIDGGSYAVKRASRAGNQALSMALSPSGDALWLLYNEPASLVEFPLDTLQARRRIALPAPPDSFDLVIHQRRRVPLAVVASRRDHSIFVASLADSKIERTINAGDEPSLVQFQWDGAQIIAGSWRDKSATIYETADGKPVVRLPLPVSPRQFCMSADGGQLFITGDGMDAVVVLFPSTTEVYQTILAGRTPGAMAVTGRDVRPSYLMVTNPESDGITVLDVENYGLVATVQVGQGPCRILLTPDGQYALVLNAKSGDMAVIRLLALSTTPNGGHRKFKTAPIFTLIPVGDHPVSAALLA